MVMLTFAARFLTRTSAGRSPGVVAVLVALLAVSSASCKKEATAPDTFIVLYAAPNATLSRGGKKLALRVGDQLRTPDTIRTGDGSVDLQSRKGLTLRIRKFTEIQIGVMGIPGGEGLHLKNGGIMARMDRKARAEDFQISTPTSIASVRGTTFSVAVEDGKRPVVKVLEGRVALAPRAEIAKKEGPAEYIQGTEQILDGGQSGSLPAKMEDDLLRMATLLSNSVIEQDRRLALERDLKDTVRGLAVETKALALSPQEEAEKDTLVKVDSEIMNELLEKGLPEVRVKLAKEYERRLDAALTVVEKKVGTKTFKSKGELLDHYKVLEIVVTKDGKSHPGAVVAQAGDTLILHTVRGVERMKKDRVNYIDYVQ